MSITIVYFGDFAKNLTVYFRNINKKPPRDLTQCENSHIIATKTFRLCLTTRRSRSGLLNLNSRLFDLIFLNGNNSCACDNCGSICQGDLSYHCRRRIFRSEPSPRRFRRSCCLSSERPHLGTAVRSFGLCRFYLRRPHFPLLRFLHVCACCAVSETSGPPYPRWRLLRH